MNGKRIICRYKVADERLQIIRCLYVLREEVQLTNSICDSQFSCCQFCCCCVGVAANCSWCPAQRKAAVVGEASAALAAAVKNVANNNKDIL